MRVLLTVEQVALRLGVGRTTVYALLRQGKLPRLKVGGATRIAQRDLEAYVDGLHERPAVEPDPISAGQLRALHAMAGRLDRERGLERGSSKRAALAQASERAGRAIESASQLSALEASQVLDSLEQQLGEA